MKLLHVVARNVHRSEGVGARLELGELDPVSAGDREAGGVPDCGENPLHVG